MHKWALKLASDESLMSAYANGSDLAFECLYSRHKKRLFNFLRRQCDNQAICEELTHDTWLAVITCAKGYQKTANFTTWLFRIAHNRLVDHWRKHGNSATVLFEELCEKIEYANEHISEGLEIEDLAKNLEGLAAEQLEALLLKIEGFSHAEIADITDAKQETVKSRLRYANKHLRIVMESI